MDAFTNLQNQRAAEGGQRIAEGLRAGMTLHESVLAERERQAELVADAVRQGGFALMPPYDGERYVYDVVAGADRIVVAEVWTSHLGLTAKRVADVPYGTLDGYPVVDDVIASADAGRIIAARLGLVA
jgi:hypothetical protein